MINKIMQAIKTTLVIENKQSIDLLESKITKILNEEVRKDSVKKCHQTFCPYDNSMIMDRNVCEMEKCKYWW